LHRSDHTRSVGSGEAAVKLYILTDIEGVAGVANFDGCSYVSANRAQRRYRWMSRRD
jgi:hypothetical protein